MKEIKLVIFTDSKGNFEECRPYVDTSLSDFVRPYHIVTLDFNDALRIGRAILVQTMEAGQRRDTVGEFLNQAARVVRASV